ncbi:ran-binding protein 10-like isoform X2 [Halichondria panicea]|uniref:ran-binding protein 10-like isoform X2 n=1 Tax=Halichondria panicea TaxID=6063 RepID=UPI00312B9194
MEINGNKFGGSLCRLYPKVDETENPLPRTWSTKDKFTYIGLSQGNLRAHYKGSGKNHKDAASVRVSHPIPAACGVYYFEVKIISKGRDGYIGIGLSSSGVNLNRLPGWEKNSYGYHADDGCVFSSTGTGQKYGPTFSTGDVVGCGFNLVDHSIFFTKNGITLGTAFTDVSANLNLYPMVGLQTPGEIIEGNFGETSFMFDFEGLLAGIQQQVKQKIMCHPVFESPGGWQGSVHKVVLSYLVHHGYSQTAQVFASCTGQGLGESTASIMNRQRVQSLILQGRISEARLLVHCTYKGLLENNLELLFRLKCRQFVEMIGGYDRGEIISPTRDLRLSCHSDINGSTDLQQSFMDGESPKLSGSVDVVGQGDSTARNGQNGDAPQDASMDVDQPERNLVNLDSNPVAIERVLAFGRDLQVMYSELKTNKPNKQLKTLLQDSFSLLAYTEPQSSPVGYLLDPIQREPVSAALNSAILETPEARQATRQTEAHTAERCESRYASI